MSLCLATAAVAVALGWQTFTLTWTHSVEKTEWQEDWRVAAAGLDLVAARVKTTGAGMEPPPGARLADGWWHYRPELAPLSRLVLARHGGVEGWRLCHAGRCRPLDVHVGPGPEPVVLTACPE